MVHNSHKNEDKLLYLDPVLFPSGYFTHSAGVAGQR